MDLVRRSGHHPARARKLWQPPRYQPRRAPVFPKAPRRVTPAPDEVCGLNMSIIRLTPGAISLSISSHFPIRGKSMNVKPVMFPPGRARLAIKPCRRFAAVRQVGGYRRVARRSVGVFGTAALDPRRALGRA